MDYEEIMNSRKERLESIRRIVSQFDADLLNKQLYSNKKTMEVHKFLPYEYWIFICPTPCMKTRGAYDLFWVFQV
ncbi:MAG: hypothetical protein D6732_25075 [Methanobacteriota archaeon]|nr:MAG: hypothetical protein D6732_25075 [Euryarchaeota archaeon]